ncbi:MAG: UDP-N-acetylmuramoyl-L-alanine--D-glutamate ligase [Acidimicrobiia bacterium]
MKTLILGAGVSGVAAAELAASLGHSVSVYDRSSQATIPLREQGYAVHSGAWADRLLRNVGLAVVSPGFPEHSEPVRQALAADIEVISELEFGARQLTVPYVAVTGTNGKTTVTTAIAEMLNASDVSAVAAGNIGLPVCGLGPRPASVVVLEASSFQLRFIDRFHPAAAGITNVAADHLDWHGTVADYAAAKARIFENMEQQELLAYDADDDGAAELARRTRCRTVAVSGTVVPPDGIGPDSGALVIGGSRLPLATSDPSFVADLGIAAAIATTVGATISGISTVLADFTPGAHRRRTVGTKDGIRWVDDSKATNPHAARAAAAAYENVVLLAGGRNKNLDLSDLTTDTVRHVVAFGEAGPDVAVGADVPVTVVATLADAVGAAGRIARSGDTVLLAPGCASFDEFESYAARGDRFAELVAEAEASK